MDNLGFILGENLVAVDKNINSLSENHYVAIYRAGSISKSFPDYENNVVAAYE